MSLTQDQLGQILARLYGSGAADPDWSRQIDRYRDLLDRHAGLFGPGDCHLFSAPGRTEIGGNHTDHNNGRVLAASINLDTIAGATMCDARRVTLSSEGYDQPSVVDLKDLEIKAHEKGTTAALIRGIAARLQSLGYSIGGFNATVKSEVLPGSGLSSSAAIEVLIGTIFSSLFNDGRVSSEVIAKTGQYAENVYFGKPCGLMDQMASATGGVITIDFKNPENPLVKKVNFDFDTQDYCVLVVDTGGSHADLTDDYAAVPGEMRAVAAALGATVCREISYEAVLAKIGALRREVGDRAVLRAMHFLHENERVVAQVDALESGDFPRFLHLVRDSGNSSFKWLQNIYTTKNVAEQGVTLALAITEQYLAEIAAGACRVHGGGFAGAIQVFMPNRHAAAYGRLMEGVFGEGCVLKLRIRQQGAMALGLFPLNVARQIYFLK